MTGILVQMFWKFPKRHPSKESKAPTLKALRVEIAGGDDRALNQEIEYGWMFYIQRLNTIPSPKYSLGSCRPLSPDTADATYTADHAGQPSCDLSLRILLLVIASTLRLRRIGPPSEMMKSWETEFRAALAHGWVHEGAWIWTCNRINIWDRREPWTSVWLCCPPPFLKSFSSHRESSWGQIWSKSWLNSSPVYKWPTSLV